MDPVAGTGSGAALSAASGRDSGGKSATHATGSMAKAPYSASAQALPHRMSRLFTEIRWILQVALGVFLLMALVSISRLVPDSSHSAQTAHIAIIAGRSAARPTYSTTMR